MRGSDQTRTQRPQLTAAPVHRWEREVGRLSSTSQESTFMRQYSGLLSWEQGLGGQTEKERTREMRVPVDIGRVWLSRRVAIPRRRGWWRCGCVVARPVHRACEQLATFYFRASQFPEVGRVRKEGERERDRERMQPPRSRRRSPKTS